MTDNDYLLAQGPVIVKGPLDLESLSDFNSCLIQHNPVQKVTKVQSLVDTNGIARAVPCPRDDINSYVQLDGNLYQSDSCCSFCMYQIDCYVLGVTKQFVLASKA